MRDAYEEAHLVAKATAKEVEAYKLERARARARARPPGSPGRLQGLVNRVRNLTDSGRQSLGSPRGKPPTSE
mgnify:CR=1 FL=1